jgi:hypothetical protein
MGVSDSLLAEIGKLDTEAATAYADYLISLGEDGFAAYVAAWEERQEKARELAEQFYQNELTELKTKYTDEMLEALSELEDAGYTLGADTAAGIAAGILSGQSAVEDAVAQIILGGIAAGQEAAEIHSPSKLADRALGQPIPQGAAGGVRRNAGAFKSSVSDMMADAISEVQGAASGLSDAFNVTPNYTPARFPSAVGAAVARVTGLPRLRNRYRAWRRRRYTAEQRIPGGTGRSAQRHEYRSAARYDPAGYGRGAEFRRFNGTAQRQAQL